MPADTTTTADYVAGHVARTRKARLGAQQVRILRALRQRRDAWHAAAGVCAGARTTDGDGASLTLTEIHAALGHRGNVADVEHSMTGLEVRGLVERVPGPPVLHRRNRPVASQRWRLTHDGRTVQLPPQPEER